MKKLTSKERAKALLPVRNALEVIGGKWRLQIMLVLITGTKRFSEIEREIQGIGPRMLSKELKELEIHELVTRTVNDATPSKVEYSVTEYGKTLKNVVSALQVWGRGHRDRMMR